MNMDDMIEEEMRINMGECFNAARKAGHNIELAENCEEGNLECPDCPWQGQTEPKKGWKITPSFDLPDQEFELREDTDFLYLYQGFELISVYSRVAYTSTKQLKSQVLVDCDHAVMGP